MKVRNLFLILGILGLALVVLFNLHSLSAFIKLIKHIRYYVALLTVLVQILSYFLNGLYYQSILYVFGYRIKVRRLFEGAMAANFVNYIAPTAGMAGAAYLSQVLSPEVPRGEGVLVQFMRYALSALAVLIMLPVGLILVITSHYESSKINHIAIYGAIIITAAAFVIVGLVNQEKWVRKVAAKFARLYHRIFKNFPINRFNEFADDFYIGYRRMTGSKVKMLKPFGWSIIYIFAEILTVYLSFLAFGKVVNPGIPIMGYLLANIASTFGGTFFSTGVFELGMLGTFVAFGINFPLALSITLFYRILNLLIGLPPGFYFYRKYLKNKSSK